MSKIKRYLYDVYGEDAAIEDVVRLEEMKRRAEGDL